MISLEEMIKLDPYSFDAQEKNQLFDDYMAQLSASHYNHCKEYKRICDILGEETPALPVRLFKTYELLSVPKEEIVKTMTSSGTTGQAVSKIFLDKKTASNQTKVLSKIASNFLGSKRLPMLILDTKDVIKDRSLFSARGAGILGFSMLGYDITFALDEKMEMNLETIELFLEKHKEETILLFGFTYMIWKHFYQVLINKGKKLDLRNAIMLHGGGWKKLIEESVDNEIFKEKLGEVCGIRKVFNYYGMVEQTGSIYMECECGRLHASNFSDIIIKNPIDFSDCSIGEMGLVTLMSLIPESYPGHYILTEDLGELIGEDDCPCGRLGKTFKIYGRIKNAEVRGCSDTYANKN